MSITREGERHTTHTPTVFEIFLVDYGKLMAR
jgi:hypothetical protein